MERIIQILGPKRVKIAIAILVTVALVIAPLAYILPLALAAEENVNVTYQKEYNADAKKVDITVNASQKEGIDTTIESITMPNGETVEAESASLSVDKNGTYKFKVNYSIAIASSGTDENAELKTESKSQTITITVDDIVANEVQNEEKGSSDDTASKDGKASTTNDDTISSIASSNETSLGKGSPLVAGELITVKFITNVNGTALGSSGNSSVEMTLDKGATLEESEAPKVLNTNVDKEFAFWSENKNASSDAERFNLPQAINSAIDLYAIFKDKTNNRYEITLDANGGKFTNDYALERVKTVLNNEHFELPTGKDIPVKDDSTFSYWAWDEDGKQKVTFSIAPTNDLRFYAIYNPKNVTVKWFSSYSEDNFGKFSDNTTMKVTTIPYNSVFEEPEAPIPISGKEFLHWVNCEVKYDFSKPVTANPLVLVAKYKDVSVSDVKVTFNPDSGTLAAGTVSPLTVKVGEKVAKPANPTPPTGKRFLFWTVDGQNEYDFSKPVTEDTTLRAVYTSKCTVTFDPNGGILAASTTSPLAHYIGDSVKKPSNPTPPTGKEFSHWTLDGKTEYNFNTALKDSITLKAVYAINSYDVTLSANGNGVFASNSSSTKVDKGVNTTAYSPTESPKANDGKKFIGWSISKDSKVADAKFPTSIQKNSIYYAIYENISYDVTFNAGKGTLVEGAVNTQKVVHGKNVAEPNASTIVKAPIGNVNKVFDYWSLNQNAVENSAAAYKSEKFNFITTPILKATNIYAIYANDLNNNGVPDYRDEKYVVNIRSNGGEFKQWVVSPEKVTHTYLVLLKTEFSPDSVRDAITAPNGKAFDYWASKADAEKGAYAVEFPIKRDDSSIIVDAYAIFADDTNGNGKPDYKETKWNVSFNTDSASNSANDAFKTQEVLDGLKAVKPTVTPVKAGYDFLYWSVNNNEFVFIESPVKSNVEIKAVYKIKTFNVTIDAGAGKLADGTSSKVVPVDYNKTFTKPANPTPNDNGQVFDKWVDSQGDEFDFNTPIKGSVTVKATYKDLMHDVILEVGKGTLGAGSSRENQVKHGTVFAKPTNNPIAENDSTSDSIRKIIFDYWSINSNPEVGKDQYDFTTPINGKVTLYAIYAEDANENGIPDYKEKRWIVTFNTKGADNASDYVYRLQDVLDGLKAEMPPVTPVKKGYEFLHWIVDGQSETERYDFTAPIHKDTVIIAIYKINKYNVTIDAGEGTLSEADGGGKDKTIEVNHGDKVTKPTNPTPPEGKEFDKWVDDNGGIFDFEKGIEGTSNITAVYKTKVYDVNLNQGKGTFVVDSTINYKVEHGNKFEESKAPSSMTIAPATPANSIFDYWSENKNSNQAYSTEKYDFSTNIVKSTTLYAIFAVDNDKNGVPDYRQNDFKVTFDTNGGLDANFDVFVRPAVAVAKPVNNPTPQKGMAFDYWSLNQNVKGNIEQNQYDFATLINANTILYAIYGVDENGNGVPDYRDVYYDVTLSENGGSFPADTQKVASVLTGMTFAEPTFKVTAPEGKAFDYWSTNASAVKGADKYNFADKIEKATTIFAIYGDDENGNGIPDYRDTYYDVTLNENSGSFPTGTEKKSSVLSGMKFAEPTFTVTAPEGKAFDYWSKNANANEGADKFSFATKIRANTDLYAIYGDDENGNGIPDYRDTYIDVEFFANGGTMADGVVPKLNVLSGTTINPIASPTAPTDMAFDYWSVNKDAKGDYEKNQYNFASKIEKATNLYAIYAEDKDGDGKPDYRQDDYKVTFDMNGGLDNSFDVFVKPAASVVKPSATPKAQEGMTFDYWSLNKDANGDLENNQYDFATAIKADTTIFAIYGVDENGNGIPDYRDDYYDVTLSENGGSFPTDTQKVVSVLTGNAFAEPAFTVTAPTGKAFDYWSTNASAVNSADKYNFATPITANTTIFAIYGDDQNGNGVPDYRDTYYYVTLSENGGSFPADTQKVTSVLSGTTFAEPKVKVTAPTGMAFDYWSENSAPAQGTEKFNFGTKIEKATTIYAVYADDKNGNGIPDYRDTYYDVEFIANGGTMADGVVPKINVLTGTTINPIASPKAPTGMAFDYWSENKDSQGNYLINQFNFASKIEKATNLYAIYAEDKDGDGKPDYRQDDYKVTFDMNGGLDRNFDVLVRPATTVAKPSAAPKAQAGMAFDYWAINKDAKGEIDKNQYNFATAINADTTVFAIYGVDENGNGIPDYRDTYYDVKINANNGKFADGTQIEYKVLANMTFAEPKVTMTAPEGTVFDYWSLNSNAKEGADIYNFNSRIAKNTEIYAIFSVDNNGNGVPDYKDAKFTVTATAGNNGRISPNGAVSVLTGTAKTFIIVPNTGYAIASITVDGSRVAIANTYTFTDVKADHTIHVTFVARSSGGGSTGGNGGGSNNGEDTGNGDNNGTTTVPPTIGTDTGADTVAPAPIVINPDGTVNIDQIVPAPRPGFEFGGFQNPEEEIVDENIPLDNLDDLEEVWEEIPDEDIALAQGHGAHNHILLIILLTLTALTGGMLVYREREKFLNKEEA